MDWLLERQPDFEKALAQRHLKEAAPVMYDLVSACWKVASAIWRNRAIAGSRDTQPIESGLLGDAACCPVVEAYPVIGLTPTVGSRINKLQDRFGLSKVVLMGNHGMWTEARMRELVKTVGLDWVSSETGHPWPGGGQGFAVAAV